MRPGDVLWLLGDSEPYLLRRLDRSKRLRVAEPPPPAAPAKKEGFVPSPAKFYRSPVVLPGFDNRRNVLDLRPLLGEPGLLRVCLTSYELDAAWLVASFPSLLNVPVFVASREAPPAMPRNWTHVAPKTLQWGTCHGKLMLLFFSNALRVILTSANHIASDHIQKSNGVWTQTFRLVREQPGKPAKIGYAANRNDFGEVLEDYLLRLGVPEEFRNVTRFECETAAVALVSSVPGVFTKDERSHYGFRRVEQILRAEGLLPGASTPLVMQCSSLGKMSQRYIETFAAALGGGPLQVVWPSVEFVRTCIHGWGAGGSICLNSRNVDADMQSVLRAKYEGVPERVGVAPHIKTLFRLQPGNDRVLSWFYMGSHNFSKSAWGESQLGDKQMRIASFEIGVMFLPQLGSRALGSPISYLLGNGNDADRPTPGQIVLPIPYKYPAEAYSYSARSERFVDMPWVWDVSWGEARDVHGSVWPGVFTKN